MKKVIATLFAVMFLPGCRADAATSDFRFELAQGGTTRSYLVHVPKGARDKRLPVVISFHGGGGNAEVQRRFTRLDEAGDRHGFLVVYPSGSGRGEKMLTWNAGACCGYAAMRGVDDVAFTRMIVDDLARRFRIDRQRVYVTGMSNGGMMAYRVAAEAPDLVAAAAPVAGSMVLVRFSPDRPVPILHIHSVDDPRALYDGGLGPPFPMTRTRVEHPPVEKQLAKWRAVNRCESEPVIAEKKKNATETATKYVWNCTAGTSVILWKLTGSGHVWPGGKPKANLDQLLGQPSTIIDANEEMWKFFSQYGR